MRWIRLTVAGLLLVAAGVFVASRAEAANAPVTITDNSFSPAQVEVTAGNAVTWTDNGDNPHSITADDMSFDSNPACSPVNTAGCRMKGQTYTSPVFGTAGQTIAYHCKIHGSAGGGGMSGSIHVIAAVTTTTKATTTTTRPPTTSSRPTSTSRATTTSSETVTTDTLGLDTTTSEDTTSTTGGQVKIKTSGGGTNGAAVALLVVGILGVLGGGGYAIYRLRSGRF